MSILCSALYAECPYYVVLYVQSVWQTYSGCWGGRLTCPGDSAARVHTACKPLENMEDDYPNTGNDTEYPVSFSAGKPWYLCMSVFRQLSDIVRHFRTFCIYSLLFGALHANCPYLYCFICKVSLLCSALYAKYSYYLVLYLQSVLIMQCFVCKVSLLCGAS